MSITEEMAEWAREVLADPMTAVLDTETTGLYGYVCEVAVLDSSGTALFNTLVNPQAPVEAGARRVHGLQDAELAVAPLFADIWPDLEKILGMRRIVVYNAEFDSGIIRRELVRLKIEPPVLNWECAMKRYSDWWADEYDARYLRLNGGHRAAEDCQAVYKRLQEMAGLWEALIHVPADRMRLRARARPARPVRPAPGRPAPALQERHRLRAVRQGKVPAVEAETAHKLVSRGTVNAINGERKHR